MGRILLSLSFKASLSAKFFGMIIPSHFNINENKDFTLRLVLKERLRGKSEMSIHSWWLIHWLELRVMSFLKVVNKYGEKRKISIWPVINHGNQLVILALFLVILIFFSAKRKQINVVLDKRGHFCRAVLKITEAPFFDHCQRAD